MPITLHLSNLEADSVSIALQLLAATSRNTADAVQRQMQKQLAAAAQPADGVPSAQD